MYQFPNASDEFQDKKRKEQAEKGKRVRGEGKDTIKSMMMMVMMVIMMIII